MMTDGEMSEMPHGFKPQTECVVSPVKFACYLPFTASVDSL